MSQGDLAEAARVYQSNLARYELAVKLPGLPDLLRLSRALGVTLDWLCQDVAREEARRWD